MDVGCGALDRDSGSGRLVWKATQYGELKHLSVRFGMVWIAELGTAKPWFRELRVCVGTLGEKLGLTLPWAFSTRTSRLKPGRSSGRRPVVQDIFKPV